MRTVWPSKFVELFPLIQFLVQVHIVFVTQQLIELRLELMTTIGPDLLDTKRKLGNDVVNKGDRVLLRMAIVDLERSHTRRIVDGGVLISLDLLARFASEYQELNIHLDVVAWNLLVVAFRMHLLTPHLAR